MTEKKYKIVVVYSSQNQNFQFYSLPILPFDSVLYAKIQVGSTMILIEQITYLIDSTKIICYELETEL